MIRIEGVEKRYRDSHGKVRTVLQKASCHIDAGDFAVICGPVSSGKTTLLNIIAGTAEPTSGTVLFDGEELYGGCPMSRTADRRHRVGWVSDAFDLLPNVSCLENIVMAAWLDNPSRISREQAARRVLDRVRLELGGDELPAQLSAQERKRALIARAIVNEPRVLLVDEPSSGLDEPSARAIADLLSELHRDGQTILMTSRDCGLGVGTRFFELRDRCVFEICSRRARGLRTLVSSRPLSRVTRLG